jgi:hypothetical protein
VKEAAQELLAAKKRTPVPRLLAACSARFSNYDAEASAGLRQEPRPGLLRLRLKARRQTDTRDADDIKHTPFNLPES